jgi:hypothetical protein
MEAKHEVGLLKYLNNWAKLQEFPGRMVDWDADQVAHAYQEASRKLASVTPSPAANPAPAAGNPAKPHQARLFSLVSKAAGIRFATDTPNLDHFKVILDMINHSDETGGEVIDSIKDCTDVPLLLNACKAAERIVNEQSTVDEDIPF